MNYSLKELSELLSVTKMTVLNHAKRLEINLEKIDNAIIINQDQALIIADSINSLKSENSRLDIDEIFGLEKIDKGDDKEIGEEFIKILKRQLADKERQVAFLENQMLVKDSQIKNLNDTLDNQQKLLYNQQSLALQSNEKLTTLEIEMNQIKSSVYTESNKENTDNEIDNIEAFYVDLKNEKKKESFFSKIFKR